MDSPDDLVQVSMQGQMVTMPRSMAEELNKPLMDVTIDGKEAKVPRVSLSFDPRGKAIPRLTTIYDAAAKMGIDIPILCHREYMTPVAVCRVCSVQVEFKGRPPENRLAPACYRPVEPGMIVKTHETEPRVFRSVKTLAELLMADHPTPCEKQQRDGKCELETIAANFGIIGESRMPRSFEHRPHDDSSLVIAVDHNACILCDRCVRGCNEIRNNEVIGRMAKGYKAKISFDLNNDMGGSTCVTCGECMVSCPTGALTNKKFIRPDAWHDAQPPAGPVSAKDLARLELFKGVSLPFLEWNEGAVVRRTYKAGETICREGEFGSTAFMIEKGQVKIFLQATMKHVRQSGKGRGIFGFLRRVSGLVGRGEDGRDEESTARYINVDAPVSLEYDNPVATMGEGELFGEMTCMNSYPRSATVQAATDVTVLEMLRNVLYILQRSKASRAKLESMYRKRAIDSHLRNVKIFSSLADNDAQFKQFVTFLRDRVQLIRLNPGDVIFKQDDIADSFYLVRIGFVKVAQNRTGGEYVLNYIGPGGYFGEIGLMSNVPEIQALATNAGKRIATCSALDHVDVVKINAEDFRLILDRFPQVRQQLIQTAVKNLQDNEAAAADLDKVPLGEFLRQGLMNAQSLLVLDLEKCTRCDECTKACSDAHDGVTRLIREGLRFDKYLIASSCRSCLDPYCMVGCPVGSIRRRNTREIIIEDWCIGCGKCADNCPYGNINMHPFDTGKKAIDPRTNKNMPVVQEKATMCDLCVTVDGQPSCVYACPHDAAHRMSGEELWQATRRE